MRFDKFELPIIIFAITLTASFAMAYLGRRHSTATSERILGKQKLNRWLIGLSGGATANSGFVVTGAVGLGFSYGVQWLMLPLAWLVGDVIFWWLFPQRINELGHKTKASTISDLLVTDIPRNSARHLRLLIGLVMVVCLSGYLAAQWLAGQKFLSGAFDFTGIVSLSVFAAVIIVYTAIGGFRGSVYVDSFQAIIRVIGTLLAVGSVVIQAHSMRSAFWHNLNLAGPDFLTLLPQQSLVGTVGLVAGFAFAALGFGLGQPQIVSRYLAGVTPQETRKSWWIYISFVQFTWLSMTLFGIILRGVDPNISDPEEGLSLFFREFMGPVLTGLIVADIFATIAATSNSLLVAITQTVMFDLVGIRRASKNMLAAASFGIGLLTMLVATLLGGNVVNLALSSVAMMAAGIAPAMMVRVLGWRSGRLSITSSVAVGLAVACTWKFVGFGGAVNEAAPGFLAGLFANYLVARLFSEGMGRNKERGHGSET